MKLIAAAGVVVLALVGVAAAGASGSPSAYISQYVALTNQVVQITQSDKGNCVKMATDLKAWSIHNKSTIATLNAEASKISHVDLAMAALSQESQIVSDAQKISANVLTCATNANVAAALATQSKLKP